MRSEVANPYFPFPPTLVALSGKSAFKKWVTYRKSGLFFQAIIPLKHLVCPPPPPSRAGANPPMREPVALESKQLQRPQAWFPGI